MYYLTLEALSWSETSWLISLVCLPNQFEMTIVGLENSFRAGGGDALCFPNRDQTAEAILGIVWHHSMRAEN